MINAHKLTSIERIFLTVLADHVDDYRGTATNVEKAASEWAMGLAMDLPSAEGRSVESEGGAG